MEPLLLCALALRFAQAGPPAHAPVYTIHGTTPEACLGSALDGVGDQDGDGIGDFLAGAFGARGGRGEVRVLSGADGADLRETLVGETPGEFFGASLAGLGDLDGDGVGDFAVGAPGHAHAGPSAGALRVFSGKDGRKLAELFGESAGDEFGFAVAATGDTNRDGTPDLIVGSPNASRRGFCMGRVIVLSGKDFSALRIWGGEDGEDRLGAVVSGIGDVDDDGYADVAASGLQALTQRSGHVRVYSSFDGLLIGRWGGEFPGDSFGNALAGLGDVDGDGKGEVAVGSFMGWVDHMESGAVRVISATTGAIQHTWRGSRAGDRFGAAVARAGDVDGDGASEVLVGAPQTARPRAGYVRLLSGKSGAAIATLEGTRVGQGFGARLATIDVESPDRAKRRWIVGAPYDGSRAPLGGAIYVFTPR